MLGGLLLNYPEYNKKVPHSPQNPLFVKCWLLGKTKKMAAKVQVFS